tara:strand:- start:1186 stop:1776 length:591 start_codon:yes stop_codon:yes gene_type:complete
MLKKIFLKIFFFIFVLISLAQSAESGGMPQLNPEYWISQIFWLVLTFGGMFVVLSKIVLPKISKNIETRKSQILENIEIAEKQREETEVKIKEYEKIILDSKNNAKNYFNDARIKVVENINQKRESLEKEIDKEIESAEKEISDLKNNSREKINKIAIETSSDIVKQLINADVNSSSISAIVEDLSKKNKDKYNEI